MGHVARKSDFVGCKQERRRLISAFVIRLLESVIFQRATSADPEGGDRGPDPPLKITSYMGFYRK